MEIQLLKKPKNPIIIEGFPGFGLVGTISSEFLIEHLDCEEIGNIFSEEIPAMIAIHESKIVKPMGIYYNKKYNLLFIHGITVVQGLEWKIVDAILQLAEKVEAKEIISLEGVGSLTALENPQLFYITNIDKSAKKLEQFGLKRMKEGIIMGVTGAMLYKGSGVPNTSIFAETATNLPDSKAAAKVIEVLDKYLNLNVDYKPLLEQAQKFEDKLKGIMTKSKEAMDFRDKKQLSYVG